MLCDQAGMLQVSQGGRHTEKLASEFETALTRRDEYGRVMTPKEAFRELCYKCAHEPVGVCEQHAVVISCNR